jgi:TolB protein
MSQRRIYKRRSSSRRFRLPIGLILVLIVIGLCLLLPSTSVKLGDITSSDPELPTALPTFTPPPIPTRPNIGRIIFTCTRGDFNQLCIVNADGTGYQQITNVEAHNYYPVYSPLGGSIVYASNQNGGFFDLFLFVFEGSRLIRLTENIGNVISPSFSPDGTTILFANRAADGPTSLWTVENTGKNPKLLYAGPNTIVSADWSPDGNTIAFAMAVDRPDAYEIFLMDADGTNGGNVRQITYGLEGIGGSLDWSPDEKYLLIYAGPAGDKNIFRIDVEAQVAEQLTEGGNNAACSYSPDGDWIAFNSLRNDDQADIFIMRADGSGLRQITDNPEPDWQPQWEP